jgi:hypothetical protein
VCCSIYLRCFDCARSSLHEASKLRRPEIIVWNSVSDWPTKFGDNKLNLINVRIKIVKTTFFLNHIEAVRNKARITHDNGELPDSRISYKSQHDHVDTWWWYYREYTWADHRPNRWSAEPNMFDFRRQFREPSSCVCAIPDRSWRPYTRQPVRYCCVK